MNSSRRTCLVILAFASAVGVTARSSLLCAGAAEADKGFAPWTFRENFRQGIAGWISYPLSQDVGYDPSLYTQQGGDNRGLVRDVISYGQRLLRVGMARPLKFHVTPLSSVRLAYRLETCGEVQGLRLLLGTTEGERFTYSLPAQPGEHNVEILGKQLEVPAAGAQVEVILLQAEVRGPAYGSHSHLALHDFGIQAERPRGLPIRSPELEFSPVDDVAVARDVVMAGSPLKIEVSPSSAARVSIYGDDGRLQGSAAILAGGATGVEVKSPNQPGLYRAEIVGAASKSEFRFLVLGQVPAHPRVLLTAERLAQLRSPAGANDLPGIVHRRAAELGSSLTYNSLAGRNISLLPSLTLLPGLPEYFALLDSYGDAIAYNALDYALAGDPQSLDAARRALLAVSAWPTWTPPWFSARGIHTYYEVGIFTQKVAFGYDLIADRLSPEDKSTIAEALWNYSIRPTLDDYFFYDRLPIAASNHEAHSLGGAIAACVALYGDVPDWPGKYAPALAELTVAYERLLHGLFPGDGSEAEPAGYEDFAMEGLSWGMAALHAMGMRPRGTATMLQGFWWLRYAQVRPDLVLDTGDFNGALPGHSGYAWGAEYSGDPALEAFYQTATEFRLLYGARAHDHTRDAGQTPGLLDLVCCTRTAAPALAPLSRIFPARGSAVLRSGWTPQDTVISIRVGPWFNHEHHDQGTFQVAAHGELLIGEAGYTHYYQDPRYPDFFTQAPAHNTVTVDGDAFSQQDYDGRYWPALRKFARIEDHVFSPGIDYLVADLTPAYRDESQVRRLSREYVFIKPDVLAIHDRIDSDEPHTYSWFLHPPPGAQASVDAAHAVIRRDLAFATVSAGNDNAHWQLGEQPVPVIAYRDFDRNTIAPREALRLDSPRERSASFLVALHLQKGTEQAVPLLPFRTASGEGFKFEQGGGSTTILFRRAAGSLTAGGISTDGDGLVVSKDGSAENILAVGATWLQRSRQVVFSAVPAADVAMEKLSSATELHLECAGETNLKFLPENRPVGMWIDRVRASLTLAQGFVSLAHLAKGEHVVRIAY